MKPSWGLCEQQDEMLDTSSAGRAAIVPCLQGNEKGSEDVCWRPPTLYRRLFRSKEWPDSPNSSQRMLCHFLEHCSIVLWDLSPAHPHITGM